jgi:transposase-like protein/IS1 family transposase
MNPQSVFCPNEACPARGKPGVGNGIVIHSQKKGRYKCTCCSRTFNERTGTAYARLRKPLKEIDQVVTLLAHGCPPQAIVKAYEWDERTVAQLHQRAGEHCQRVHEATVMKQDLALEHVQADEIRVKGVGQVMWLAMAMMVSTRLWLGGVVSHTRDGQLAQRLMGRVRACAKALCNVLVCVDGWTAYPKAIVRAFRERQLTRRAGRPRLKGWDSLAIGRVIKHTRRVHAAHRMIGIAHHIARGTPAFVAQQLFVSGGGIQLNTAFIERLNATFRERLALLTRRCRHAVRQINTLESGMWLLGCVYNFCSFHHSLRLANFDQPDLPHWFQRTPAMAAGLSDHCWTIRELLSFKVPPSPFVPPKKRGRPPKIRPLSLHLEMG